MQQELFSHAAPAHGGYRRSDPDTSKEAGKAMTGEKLNRLQNEVMAFFKFYRDPHACCGVTDEEMQDWFSAHRAGARGYGQSTLRSRRAELVRMGKIVDSGDRRLNRGGRKCVVWRLA